jgi:hypothetical protein
METKVDVRKLQLLNDRIAQALDALNQVRLSVHGLSHTAPVAATAPQAAVFQGWNIPQAPVYPFGVGIQGAPMIPGISHSAGMVPFVPVQGHALPQLAWLGQPIGLSHTGPETLAENYARLADPTLGIRVAQTFPFLFTGYIQNA